MELLVLIFMVTILAVVTTPLIRSSVNRAVAREAIATLRSIVAAEKRHMTKYRLYTEDLAGLGFNSGDLDGTYFSESCYTIDLDGTFIGMFDIFCIPADSDPSVSPKANMVRTWDDGAGDEEYIAIDQNGDIYSNIGWLGYDELT